MSVGRYLGTVLDGGTAMIHKILKSIGQVLPRNTVRAWTPDEVARGALIKARQEYMEALEAALGLACAEDEFD